MAVGVIHEPGRGQQQRAEAKYHWSGFGFEHEPDEYQQEYSREPAGSALEQRDEPRAIRRLPGRRRRVRGDDPLRAQLIHQCRQCFAHAVAPVRQRRLSAVSMRPAAVEVPMSQIASISNMPSSWKPFSWASHTRLMMMNVPMTTASG